LPDPAGEPVAPVLLHQLEEVRLPSLLVGSPRLGLHRGPAGVGLQASASPARASRAALLHDRVADLTGAAAAEPMLTAEHQPAAHPGAPEDADQRVVRTTRAERGLGLRGHADVVADSDGGAQGVAEPGAELEGPVPVGQVPRPRHLTALAVHVAGRADAHPREHAGLEAGIAERLT